MLTRKWNWTKTNETETGRSCLSGWQRLNGRCEGQQEETQTAFLYAGCSLCLSPYYAVVLANFSYPATRLVRANEGKGSIWAMSVTQRRSVVSKLRILFKGLSHWYDGHTMRPRYDFTLHFKWDLAHWRRHDNDVFTTGRYDTMTTQHAVSYVAKL
jgi:hypothetical protein